MVSCEETRIKCVSFFFDIKLLLLILSSIQALSVNRIDAVGVVIVVLVELDACVEVEETIRSLLFKGTDDGEDNEECNGLILFMNKPTGILILSWLSLIVVD